MKILFITLASFLFINGSLAKISCHKCTYEKPCENEGEDLDCKSENLNCFVSKSEKGTEKNCYADRGNKNKPQLLGLKDIPVEIDTELSGCVNIKYQEENKQAYQFCLCNGKSCNTDNTVKSDMKAPDGEEGERECFTCGNLDNETPCTEKELEEKKTEKCSDKVGNCFLMISKDITPAKNNENDDKIKTFRGCMPKDTEDTFGYGSVSFKTPKQVEGTYHICSKNECNLDQKSWEDSSVAGLTSSLAVLLAGLVSFKLFN